MVFFFLLRHGQEERRERRERYALGLTCKMLSVKVVRAADGSMNPSGKEEIRNIVRTEPQQEGQDGSDDAVNSPQPGKQCVFCVYTEYLHSFQLDPAVMACIINMGCSIS